MLKLKNRKLKMFGVQVPLWALLLIGLLTASAAVLIIIRIDQHDRVSVRAMGLEWRSGDATISTGSINIDYDVYEFSTTELTEAYFLKANNAQDKNMYFTPLVPSGLNWSSVNAYTLTASDSLGHSVDVLDWDGSSWSVLPFGLMDDYECTMSIVIDKGSGTDSLQLDQLFDVALTNEEPSKGTFAMSYDHLADMQSYFALNSNNDADGDWMGFDPADTRVTEVLAHNSGTGQNYTAIWNPVTEAYDLGTDTGASIYEDTGLHPIPYGTNAVIHVSWTEFNPQSTSIDYYILKTDGGQEVQVFV